MVGAEEALEIRVLHRHGKGIREIARDTGISRNTVRRYLRDEEATRYKPRPPRPAKLDPFKAYVVERLRAAAPERIPASVLLMELRERGYTGGYTMLKMFTDSLRPKELAAPIIRFETEPGEQMQMDWAVIRRGSNRLSVFVAALGWSRATYVEFVTDERVETLIEAHENAFLAFSGVPHEVLYDNMRTVVVERHGYGRGRHRFHPGFLDFARHCGFQPRLCAPYRAQTKGKVERFIRYLRQSFLLARCWFAAGREVRLINPRFLKPFVKGSKNDAVDAEAIFEAAMRPTMRFVPVKSTDQQDLQSLHRARDRLICQRTALINHTRGLLAEYGIVLPQGPWRFTAQAPAVIAGADLSDLARAIFGELLDQLGDLDRRIKKFDATMVNLCRTNEMCRRLAKLPGVGPVVATAIVAAVNEGRQFRSGREMAAWIGLVPRQYTTGGKPRLGGIGRRANHYLRRQLIHGARAVVGRLPKRDDRRANWLKALVARRGFNRTIVALANKTARIAWALLNRKEAYAVP